MKLTRQHFVFAFVAFLLIMAVCAAVGHPIIPPEALAGIGIVPFFGDTEAVVTELKTAVVAQNTAWEEFKKTNDARLKAVEQKLPTSDFDAKLTAINADFKKMNDDLVALAAKAGRPANDDSKSLTTEQQEFKTAYGAWVRKGDEAGVDLKSMSRKAYNSGSGPDGAFLILPEVDREIMRVVGVVSAIGRLATQKVIGTDTYKKMAKTTGLAARRVGPGATGGESTNPKFAELEFPVHPAEAEPWVFNETLEDMIIDVEGDLNMEAAIAFAELAGVEFAAGTGVGSARGITGYDTVANASYAWGKLGYIGTGASAAFAASNPGDVLIQLQHALKAQYRPGAAWVMPDSVLATIRQMKDGSGAFYLWQPDPLAGFGGRLLGSPVEVDDNMPVAAANSFSVAYGDFKQGYVVVNRTGIALIRDNVTAKGKTKFNFRRRFGGGVQNFEAIKLLKFI